ncbi:MAG: type I phosphomannose isomerase catalytic subunit [Kiritimatiellia bacterium]
MTTNIYPLLFMPVYKDYIWGGTRIREVFQRPNTPPRCAESWEVADRPEGMSVVANGARKGQTLQQLVQELGPDLMGPQHADRTVFPLLIKLIDAREVLSVQVHPNDSNAHRTGGEPKTEMWYLLDATADASIYAGMQPGTTPERYQKALKDGTLETLLAKVAAKPGRCIFVPGGKVHAIGAGCLLLEIQQNSNTTYRVFDWNRVDAEGNSRELHFAQAQLVIDWDRLGPEISTPRPLPAEGQNHPYDILTSPYFATTGWNLHEPRTFEMDPPGFRILFVSKGKVLIGANGVVAAAPSGTSCLIPAAAPAFTVSPVEGHASIVEIQAP